MDKNFKAEHLHDRWTDDQAWLMDGLGFLVTRMPYQTYLSETNHPLEVTLDQLLILSVINAIQQRSACNNHRVVNQANATHAKLEASRIGAMACAVLCSTFSGRFSEGRTVCWTYIHLNLY